MSFLFCIPYPWRNDVASGSAVRPFEIRKALESIGIFVSEISGSSEERKKLWKSVSVKKNVSNVYVELSTMPIALTDSDHLPRRPFLDMGNLRRMRCAGIPVAVFYRDIHWQFPQYKKEVMPIKRFVAKIFYYLELWQMTQSISHLFLPSMRMLDEIPINFPRDRVSALPPGCVIRHRNKKKDGPLQFFYVGGVMPPLYDISPMFTAIARTPEASLIICCREWEWQKVQDYYKVPENAKIVHRSGKDLDELYASADIFLMFWKITRYLEFAMPVKLFEAIGAGLPVITNANSEMGNFVGKKACGWAVDDEDNLTYLMSHLSAHPDEARAKGKKVEEIRWQHTWDARARQIIDVLDSCRSERRI